MKSQWLSLLSMTDSGERSTVAVSTHLIAPGPGGIRDDCQVCTMFSGFQVMLWCICLCVGFLASTFTSLPPGTFFSIVLPSTVNHYIFNVIFVSISYLLLCQKKPKTSMLEKNKHLIFHSLCRSGIWKWLSEAVLSQIFFLGCKSTCQLGLQSSEGILALENTPFWYVTHMTVGTMPRLSPRWPSP